MLNKPPGVLLRELFHFQMWFFTSIHPPQGTFCAALQNTLPKKDLFGIWTNISNFIIVSHGGVENTMNK